MDKKSFERIRLRTQMSEMKNVIETSRFTNVKEQAKLNLEHLQESYKGLFGEYSQDHIIESVNEEENSKWEVLSAKRSDGKTFSIGDKYADANNHTYTIDKLEFFKNNLVAHAKEGGKIDL